MPTKSLIAIYNIMDTGLCAWLRFRTNELDLSKILFKVSIYSVSNSRTFRSASDHFCIV